MKRSQLILAFQGTMSIETWYTVTELMAKTGYGDRHMRRLIGEALKAGIIESRGRDDTKTHEYKLAAVIVLPENYRKALE